MSVVHLSSTAPWSLRRFVAELFLRGGPSGGPDPHRRDNPDDGPDLHGSGVPPRPSPGGLAASAAATRESDGR
jgi:hypothetical protein